MHRRYVRRVCLPLRQQAVCYSSPANNSSSSSPQILHGIYKQQADTGIITYDPVQVRAVHHLDALYDQIIRYGGPNQQLSDENRTKKSSSTSGGGSWWQRLVGGSSTRTTSGAAKEGATAALSSVSNVPKGLYLYGGVGCGKTFVMDMFFDNVPIEKKLRVHFHKFMLDIHKQMHHLRQSGRNEDPIPFIVDDLLKNSWLLCFDEFQVTDVADALILRRLFSALLERGFVMVATSNRPPSELYKNGLQRDLFLPFIDLLSERCEVVSLTDSATDYRVLKGVNHAQNVYNFPLAETPRAIFNYEFLKYCQGEELVETDLETQGRKVHVPQAALSARACQFSFQELCDKPLGAADYLAIADAFSVVFVRDIPKLKLERINQMRRFITFVDCMYDRGVRLHCLADAAVEELYEVDANMKTHIDEVFAFDRTVSRLLEMGSEAYLLAHSENAAKGASLNATATANSHLYLQATPEAASEVSNEGETQEQGELVV